MKTIEEIKAEIKKCKEDDRYTQPPAIVEVNAPLALIQVALVNRITALEWVLGEWDRYQEKDQ